MGRQIQLHILPEDRDALIRFVLDRDPVVLTERDSASRQIRSFTSFDVREHQTLCFWNRGILPHLERTWIDAPGYYRVDELRRPTLEFSPSFNGTWEGKPALCQGRVYGIFKGKSAEFETWFEAILRWVKRNFMRNPSSMGGYVGPAAYEFYQNGGYLLPNFIPPNTDAWLREIGKQHAFKIGTPR